MTEREKRLLAPGDWVIAYLAGTYQTLQIKSWPYYCGDIPTHTPWFLCVGYGAVFATRITERRDEYGK